MRTVEKAIFTNMCMLRDEQGRVLVQGRVDPQWGGLTFPGGHVEPGESFTDAMVREFFEETGLTISQLRLCGIKQWPCEDGARYVVLFYRAEAFTGELCSSEEGEVFWMEVQDLQNSPRLAPDMDKMLRVFLEDSLTEHYYGLQDGEWKESLK